MAKASFDYRLQRQQTFGTAFKNCYTVNLISVVNICHT